MRDPVKEENKDPRVIGTKVFQENLNIEQRNQLTSMLKKMLPPVPSKGIVDIRFSFWFVKQWYVVFIFGKDTREGFKSVDKGDMDRSMSLIAKAVTYIIMFFITLAVFLMFLYTVKSTLGIDIMPDKHLTDFMPWLNK